MFFYSFFSWCLSLSLLLLLLLLPSTASSAWYFKPPSIFLPITAVGGTINTAGLLYYYYYCCHCCYFYCYCYWYCQSIHNSPKAVEYPTNEEGAESLYSRSRKHHPSKNNSAGHIVVSDDGFNRSVNSVRSLTGCDRT